MKKGAVFTIEHRRKLSLVAKRAGRRPPPRTGCVPWNKGIQGVQVAWNKGRPMAKASREKLRASVNRLYREKPEVIQKISASVKKLWRDPVYRAKCENAQKGEKARLWKGGIANEPYDKVFTREYRELIRKRDNFTCQLCGLPGTSIHHIDYNKKHSDPRNLITLCFRCHSKTNHNRPYWQKHFTVAETN